MSEVFSWVRARDPRIPRSERTANSLWTRLVRICSFNPYRASLFSERGRGVYRAISNLNWNNLNTAENNIRLTMGAIRKLVSGEGPTPGEMTRTRRRAQRVYPTHEMQAGTLD